MWEKVASVLVILAVIITAILGCWVMHEMLTYEPDPNYVPPEKPHLYWKDIDVVITDIQKDRSLNNRFLRVTITVKSKEYNLEEDFIFEGNWYYRPKFWDAQEGDIIKAQLYSWVMDSTGQVVKRDINCLY